MIPPAPTRIVVVPGRDVGDHDGGRGACDSGGIVMLGEPETPVPQRGTLLVVLTGLRKLVLAEGSGQRDRARVPGCCRGAAHAGRC
jgi:hypothetical protein